MENVVKSEVVAPDASLAQGAQADESNPGDGTHTSSSPQAQGGQQEPPAQATSSPKDDANSAKGDNASTHVQPSLPKSPTNGEHKEPPKPQGPPTMMDLCNVGGVEAHTPRIRESSSTQSREEIKYMFIHEYADGLNKLLETQWYTVHGIERLFAHHELCEEFAGTLELFANTKSNQFEQMRWLPPAESKLVWQLMQLPRCVSNPNPADTDLQTVIARLEVLECLITGRTILRSPTSFGPPQPGMDPRQSFFWRNLGDAVTQSTLCNAHWGLPTVPNAFSNAEVALRSMKSVLDNIEPRDVLYSAAVLRHLGPRHVAALSTAVTYPVNMPQLDPQGQQERAKVAVAKRFLEDEASGRGTTQVIQRVCGMVVRSWSYWRLT